MAPVPPGASPYRYIPTEWVCALYVSLYGLSTLLHTAQAVQHRLWWLLATAVCCGIGEIIGWSGRLWSSLSPLELTPFLIQISTTILSPTFLVAANFIILGRIINLIGPQFSRLSPLMYSVVFLTADTAALIVQAIGGAQASAATTLDGANRGALVMLIGILVQFVAIIIYVSLAAEFLVRYALNKPLRKGTFPRPSQLDQRLRLMVLGLSISTLFLVIRTVYRTIELQDGWGGRIIAEEHLFNALDGMPITVAMFTLNVFHPGLLVFNKGREVPGARSTDDIALQPKEPSKTSSDS